ncbi:MAG TPA: DUF1206 domain-containing protein [Streptosporangiaceae bacterium]|nr:DUF1206 domain-containing protein [Streptosporangiaceae bacterium]
MLSGSVRRDAAQGRTKARSAARSRPVRVLGRAGIAAKGTMYVLVGWIALEVAFGHPGTTADSHGALLSVRSTSVGLILLWLLGAGLAGLALWRLVQVCYGTPSPGGRKLSARGLSAIKAVLYGFLAYSTLRFAAGGGAPQSTNRQSSDMTAKLMQHPGGQIVVVIAGLVLIGAGGYLIWQALRRAFLNDLLTGQLGARQLLLVTWLGEVGGIARGIVFGAAGVFLVVAGVRHNPGEAKGLDSTLRSFAHTPAGPWLLVLVAAGLVVFGCYSWLEARWRKT